jgi:hypothetical protein
MEESTKDKKPNFEDYLFLKEYEDMLWEFSGLPPERDIHFSIDLNSPLKPENHTIF